MTFPSAHPTKTHIPAAGPWTALLWQAGSPIRHQVAANTFVARLVEGSLEAAAFDAYLGQDALYLQEYSRVLAALATRAAVPEDRAFWGHAANRCLVVESALHRTWLDGAVPPVPAAVTSQYTSFLMAAALEDSYPVAAAAVLPCFWMYAETGASLPDVPEDHPYAAWLATYHADEFTAATAQATAAVERALAGASARERADTTHAFLTACRLELDFFGQTSGLATLMEMPR